MIDQAAPAPAPAPPTTADPAGRLLLVVDDEPDLAPMFRRFLRRHFAEFLEAGGASQASALLSTRPVTHLVIDASLPDNGSGQSLALQWRSQCPTVRFVALFSGSESLRGATLPGIDRVFIKPEGFDALVEALKA